MKSGLVEELGLSILPSKYVSGRKRRTYTKCTLTDVEESKPWRRRERGLHQEQQAMNDRIDNLGTDLRLSEQRTRHYFDNKLDAHKPENDARMDEI